MPKVKLTLDEFLSRNRVDAETWKLANVDWDLLLAIAEDHTGQIHHLRESAELFARILQRFPAVHSVRWRVKDVEHLLEKIVRKRAEEAEKYLAIDPANYFEVVTDLVGVRALHLFKDDCFAIDKSLRATWTPHEQPKAYFREGDPTDLLKRFTDSGFSTEKHPAGYRSVHYVFANQPLMRKVFTEVQVRTIFEEGWSEIDHHVRYPNFSDDELVAYFLTIFNRLAGSADEMGSFVQGLAASLTTLKDRIQTTSLERDRALASMEQTLSDLEKMKQQDASMNQKVAELQAEVAKLRSAPSLDSLFRTEVRNPLATLNLPNSDKLLADLAAARKIDMRKFKGLLDLDPPENALAKHLPPAKGKK